MIPHRGRKAPIVYVNQKDVAAREICPGEPAQTRSITSAIPCPTPMHIVHSA